MSSSYNRREFMKTTLFALLATGIPSIKLFAQPGRPPNVVIIFLDDSGWGDFKPFSNPGYPTPHVNKLASEGCRFNNFYVPQAICSASRAALLTGCYPGRTGVFGAHGPGGRGLEPEFPTLGEVLQEAGYTTAVFGKWHIGDQPDTRPPARGFDESAGLMYSNDMWRYHPSNPEYWGREPLQYWENGSVVIEDLTPSDQKTLTTRYTEHAVDFIHRNAEDPFFLYVPHSMPHVPLFVSDKFQGQSGIGLYGDVIMELDWSVGQIMNALSAHSLEHNTLVVFTSDNGPWLSYGEHAGKTPYREGKATSFDGGVRSAMIMKYPGNIPAGTSSERALCSIDILPTAAYLAGVEFDENSIDGINLWDVITDKRQAENPHDYYAFSTVDRLEGVMSGDGRWKLHLPHQYQHITQPGQGGFPGETTQQEIELSLFDMEADPYERMNVINEHPDIAQQLQDWAEEHRQKFYME